MDKGMTKEEYYQEWFTGAEMYSRCAEYLTSMTPLPLNIFCFHCQQAAEKMLKGFIVMQNVRPQKTHDLLELLNLCETYEHMNSDFFRLTTNVNR
jgi:HEPN domain-containing protein